MNTIDAFRCMNDAAAFGNDERCAQRAVVPPDPRSLAQPPPPLRISSFCVCACVPFVYKPSMNVLESREKEARCVDAALLLSLLLQ